jgi:hypothetical protein
MNYFNPFPLCVDNTVTTAWKFQITEAAKTPWLAELLAQRGGELFPRFVTTYSELRALPRGARRALQRRLAHSRELSAVLQEWLQQQSSRALQQKLAATLAGAALLLVLGRGVVEANTITVDTTVPGVVADGKCSLIEAIINANDTVTGRPLLDCAAGDPLGEDHIVLPKKTFSLTAPYDTYYYGLPTGLPLITSKITIEGNGAKITRKKSAPNFRLMAVSYYSGNLELKNLTLSGGSGYYGGAILNGGELTVTNSTITGNTARLGGGIANYHELTVTNSTISKNSATQDDTFFGSGGGIANSIGATLTVTNSTITGNTASYGGALLNSGSLTLQNTMISKNTAKGFLYGAYYTGGVGGGIANLNGTLTITNSTITRNKADASGGIHNSGTMEINGSTLSKNAAFYGGGIGNVGPGTITNSIISGNKANLKTIKVTDAGYTSTYFIGGLGGGVNNSGHLTISNSTISGNKATGKFLKTYPYFAGGVGGGVMNYFGDLTLTGGMVTKNTATIAGGGLANISGTYTYTPGTITGNKAKYYANIFTY